MADSRPNLPTDSDHLLTRIAKNYSFQPLDVESTILNSQLKYKNLKKGQTYYLPIQHMLPGQGTYSLLTVKEKIRSAVNQWGVHWNPITKKWQFPQDSGKAIFPPSKTVLGILLADCIVIIDGNHKTLTSLYYGASTVPVRIAKNWSHLNFSEAKAKLLKKELIFPYDVQGKELVNWPTFTDLQDNPFRFLVTKLLLKTQIEMAPERVVKLKNLRGNPKPLIIKINRDHMYLELLMADMWVKMGLDPYLLMTSEDWEQQLREATLKEFKKKRTRFSFLRKLLVVDPPLEVSSIKEPNEEDIKNIELRIKEFLDKHHTCDSTLKDMYF